MRRRWTALALAVGTLTGAGSGQAQWRDAQVLRPGEVRVEVAPEYLHFSTRFGAAGREPLAGGRLTPDTFSPLAAQRTAIAAYLSATEDVAVTPADAASLDAGELTAQIAWNTRYVPVRMAAGVLPRIELGASLPFVRNERLTTRFDIGGGNLGLNPDPMVNAQLLGVRAPGSVIGGAPYLPLADSPLGIELANRVRALTGEELALPTEPLDAAALETAFSLTPPPYRLSTWTLGDLEVDVRVLVLSTFEGSYPASASGTDVRITAGGFARLPTGPRQDARGALDWEPLAGHTGFGGRVAADAFLGERFWVSASGGFARHLPRTVTLGVFPPGVPVGGPPLEVVEGERRPGNDIDVWLLPRVRPIPELSLGAALRAEWRGEGSEVAAGHQAVAPAATRRSLGAFIRYSALPAFDADAAVLPIEAEIGFTTAVSGTGDSPAATTAFLRVSYRPRVFGAGR